MTITGSALAHVASVVPVPATKVLLVDDDQALLTAMKRLLGASEPSWEIMIAISGEEALELMKEHVFAVLITDLEMPRGDGPTLLRHVAEYHPGTIRIVHSSQNGTDSARVPAHRTLSKPAAPAHLLTIARWAVRQSVMLARGSRGSLA